MQIKISGTVHRILTTKYPEFLIKWMDGSHEKITHLQANKETGDQVRELKPGDRVRISFDIHSSESPSSGKWFNNNKVTSLEVI
jgi:hypothetical protein